jgi:aerobic-type carbon monoxide dehydrogenase small subunit (CoxS/CutS family)
MNDEPGNSEHANASRLPEPDYAEDTRQDPSTSRRPTRRQMLAGGATAIVGGSVAAGLAACGGGGHSHSTSTSRSKSTAASATGPASGTATGGTAISLNEEPRHVTSPPSTMLLYVLRDELGLRGPKFGCGLAECGACAVLADGKQIRSCVTPLSTVGKQKITTLEGLAASYDGPGKTDGGTLHPLQQAWIDEQVPQCGYCQSGMMIQAADLLSGTPHPTDAQIKEAMDGHLCRCGTHFRIVQAIKRASTVMSAA